MAGQVARRSDRSALEIRCGIRDNRQTSWAVGNTMTQQPVSQFTLKTLAEHVDGRVEGDPQFTVRGLANLEEAEPHQLSFVARNRLRPQAEASRAGAILVRPDLKADLSCHRILVQDPYLAYARISQLYWTASQVPPGVHPTALIDPSVQVPPSCRIGPYVTVEPGVELGEAVELGAGCHVGAGVRIGAGTLLRPGVTLYPDTLIGSQCLLHAGVVLGADGFGFAPTETGWEKIAQLGRVVVGDRVEIGANTTIDRGALEDTRIGDDVIIDNLVQIGHNAELGDGSAMAGQSGLAGSAKVGRRVLVGGQSGIGGHISIADNVQFHGQAMVNKSIEEPGAYASGIPVQPAADWRRMVARLKQLSVLSDKVSELWKRAQQNKD